MNGTEPLDLNQIDPAVWHVLVDDIVYGPYTLGQLKSFILEGRLHAGSKIAEGDGAAFIEAGATPKLKAAFAKRSSQNENLTPNNFVVIAHLIEDRNAIVETLNELGSFGEAMPGVFLLKSQSRLAELQSEIRGVTRPGDHVLIVDASNNRLGWLGLDFDTDSHIKSLWSKSA